MAKKKDYVPGTEAQQVVWAGTLKTNVATHGATVGLSPADITGTQGDCDKVITSVGDFDVAKQAFQSASETKDGIKKPAIKNIRTVAQRIKKHAAYTTTIGEDLGIIGDEQTIDIANATPELKQTKVPSGHEFKFNLLDFFDGVNIYKKLPAATGFTFLARDTQSPYIDTATVENGTQYYAYFVEGDTEVGQRSAIVSVHV